MTPEPAPVASTLVTRPPPGPARGLVPLPAWAVVALAAGLIACVLVRLVLVRRQRKDRK